MKRVKKINRDYDFTRSYFDERFTGTKEQFNVETLRRKLNEVIDALNKNNKDERKNGQKIQ